MPTERKELFTAKILARSRTYYLDVKENSKGERYLVINESRPTADGTSVDRNRVMVFEEHMPEFVDGIIRALEFVRSGVRDACSGED